MIETLCDQNADIWGRILIIFEAAYDSSGILVNHGDEFYPLATPKKLLTIVYHVRSHTMVRC